IWSGVNPGPDGQQQRRQKGGITTTGYSLSSPQNCPNGRDHLNTALCRQIDQLHSIARTIQYQIHPNVPP
ncbi:hypothetical protein, partial [Gluconacetobacter entanii]|uniref:hypothetical protein n=1 Tax=Gluconacetobacter entanii TaxID=108528 RepID=UPI0022358E78